MQVTLQPAFPCPHTHEQCLPTISQFLWLLPTQDCHLLGVLIPYFGQSLNASVLTQAILQVVEFCSSFLLDQYLWSQGLDIFLLLTGEDIFF